MPYSSYLDNFSSGVGVTVGTVGGATGTIQLAQAQTPPSQAPDEFNPGDWVRHEKHIVRVAKVQGNNVVFDMCLDEMGEAKEGYGDAAMGEVKNLSWYELQEEKQSRRFINTGILLPTVSDSCYFSASPPPPSPITTSEAISLKPHNKRPRLVVAE